MNCYESRYPFGLFRYRDLPEFYFNDITIFYGNNGSGKSTLLNVMANKLGLKRSTPYNRTDFFEDYAELCDGVPDRSEDVYDITVIKVIDLTPDDQSDNNVPARLAEERFTVSIAKSDQTSLHNFRRITVENFNLEGALKVYVSIYYKGAVDYAEDPYATVTIFDSEKTTMNYQLTKNDLEVLELAS